MCMWEVCICMCVTKSTQYLYTNTLPSTLPSSPPLLFHPFLLPSPTPFLLPSPLLPSLRELQKEVEELKAELRALEEELEYHRELPGPSNPDDHFVLVMDNFAKRTAATFADLDGRICSMMEEVGTGDCAIHGLETVRYRVWGLYNIWSGDCTI